MEILASFTKREKILLAVVTSALFLITILLFVVLGGKPLGEKKLAETDEKKISTSTIGSKEESNNDNLPSKKQYPYAIVYGLWSGNNSVVKAVDLASGKTHVLATLPSTVKKISVLSAKELLFINQLNDYDHGKQLVLYNISTKASEVIYTASEGFGIDDYVLSPDTKYIATWEVKFAPNSAILRGGYSRVFTLDREQSTAKHLIYDEQQQASLPIHYPRAITNTGEVFLDTFLPDSGAGWAYGMSRSDFSGTKKEDISSMQGGTYGTQPSLSPNGNMLVFSGYDGTKGPGTEVKNGFRQSLLTPNTVEIYNTDTNTREKLSGLANTNIYMTANWDSMTGNIIFSVLSPNGNNDGLYIYDLNTHDIKKIVLGRSNTMSFIGMIKKDTILVGSEDTAQSVLGNLGESYASPFTSFALLVNDMSLSVEITDSYMQYIALVPSVYVASLPEVLGTTTSAGVTSFSDALKNLQLQTFYFKPTLAPGRVNQQSGGRCRDLSEAQCEALGGVYGSKDDERSICHNNPAIRKSEKICYDSPLYLYGKVGQKVQVQVNTLIYSSIPKSSGAYTVILKEAQKLEVEGKIYESIKYDYVSGISRVKPPLYGKIVSSDKVANTLQEYANALGLNVKESRDLISWGLSNLKTPYVFISFFDQKTSEMILPISFNPQPDSYLNIVFYMKGYETYPLVEPSLPVFPSRFIRKGLTAVEISGIVE